MKTVALIPAYEPDERLPQLLEELRGPGMELVVVDDGSGEKYAQVFSEAGRFAEVVSYPVNRGKGGALKAGFGYIEKKYGSGCVVVTADADGQHRPADIRRVAAAAAEKKGCLILGCRGFTKGTPLRNRTGNMITRFVFRSATRVAVSDTQTGLRAFGGEMLPYMLSIPGERYEYEMNVLMDCARKGVPIAEVPIETVYIGGNSTSHFDPVADSYRVYREIARYAASSLTSFALDYGLFALLLWAMGGMGAAKAAAAANVVARVVSSVFNYTVNRKLVFRSDGSVPATAAGYFALAAAVLALNTLVMELLMGLGMNGYWAKLASGILCSAVSYSAQRFLIFRKKEGAGNEKA